MDQQQTIEQAQPSKRIYIGNLPYTAQAADVETYLTEAGFQIERLDMTTDPFTGRNPSYCFAELFSVEEAERAISSLHGVPFQNRILRVNVHTPKNRGANGTNQSPRPARSPFMTPERAWRAQPSANGASRDGDRESYASNRRDRRDGDNQFSAPVVENGRRLYVGSLPSMEGEEAINDEMKALFKDYTVESVSKLIAPHESTQSLPGEHHYCFVDFATTEDAQAAANALNATPTPWGGNYKINMARERSNKRVVREQQVSDKPTPVRDFASSWRRAG